MKYKTMQGREIDMEKLARQHELTPAVGNLKVNARGDELGPGGQIVKLREEVMAAYYENNPKATPDKINVAKPEVQTQVAPDKVAAEFEEVKNTPKSRSE